MRGHRARSDPAVGSAADGTPLDFRGARRLVGVEEWAWYLIAGVSYVGFGVFHKFLLNWFVGPLWLVIVVVIGPTLWDRARGRRPRPTSPDDP